MQNKLQELTDKLYNEGLSKGKQEAEEMKSKAKSDAELIIKEAQDKANFILNNAKKEANELKEKSENDIKMASNQAFATLKQEIEKAIILKAVSEKVDSSINDTEFLKTIITSIVKAFNPNNTEPTALEIILPQTKQKELDSFINSQVKEICSKGLNVAFSKKISGGFKIGPSGSGYMLSFTNEDFTNIMSEYLRPKTKELLFGNNE